MAAQLPRSDVRAVVALTGAAFPEECGRLGVRGGAGLDLRQWTEMEQSDLEGQPWLWPQIGLAVEAAGAEGGGERVLGAVVLSYENQRDGTMSYWEVSKRFGCLATIHNYLYDQVLEEPLKDHECMIEYIAVSPEARGKGVGGLLMAWAQQEGAAILAKQWPEAVAAHGPLMSLWVAADNSVALRLYQKAGYSVVQKTDDGCCHCLVSRMLKAFLGHAVWYKMSKPLPAPEASALVQPLQLSMPSAPVIALSADASSAAAAAAPAPVEAPAAGEQQPERALKQQEQQQEEEARLRITRLLSKSPSTPEGTASAVELPAGKPGSLLMAAGQCQRRSSSSGGGGGEAGSNPCAAPLLLRAISNSSAAMAAVVVQAAVRRASSEVESTGGEGRRPSIVAVA